MPFPGRPRTVRRTRTTGSVARMQTLAESAVYAWPQSVVGGDTVGIHAAGPPTAAQLTIARLGGRREVVHREAIDLQPHPVPDDAAVRGCGWPVTVEVPVDPSWPSGYYEVVVRTDASRVAHEAVGFFVVRAAQPDPDRPLIALCTNTYNAYNDFGGHNLYDGGTVVSFARVRWPRACSASPTRPARA